MTEASVPTYQYSCTACGNQLEAVQTFTDAPLTQCPSCAGQLRKLFSAVGIVFKGSGFYRTDSRTGAGNGAGASGDSAGEASASPKTADATSGDSGAKAASDAKPARDAKPSGDAKPARDAKPASSSTKTAATVSAN
jgi:putative FmdB family regulatory protein